MHPDRGQNLQPRQVPWPRIEPTAFCCRGRRSEQLSHPTWPEQGSVVLKWCPSVPCGAEVLSRGQAGWWWRSLLAPALYTPLPPSSQRPPGVLPLPCRSFQSGPREEKSLWLLIGCSRTCLIIFQIYPFINLRHQSNISGLYHIFQKRVS